jgi:crotonobetainyl-CoA:carnitine CoA-transferase CaiB-like acyl-CoA transferase
MCEAIGRTELADEYPTNASRVEGREDLIAELEAVFASRSADEWAELLDRAGVPAGKIRGVLDAIEAAAAAGSDPRVTVEHPTIGSLPLIGSPIRTDGMPEPTAPPVLGQHTGEVLRECGVADTEIAELDARGAIQCA